MSPGSVFVSLIELSMSIIPDEAALLTVEGERLADQGEGGELRGDHRGGHQGPDQEHAGRVGRNRLKVRS